MKEKFDVTGMTCSACSSRVEKCVRRLDGVKEVNVNLLTNSMQVEFDDALLTSEDIIGKVVKAGYGASVKREAVRKASESVGKEAVKDRAQEEISSMKRRLIISFLCLIPLMYISMYHMFYEWFGLPIPKFVNQLFHGTENTITFAFSQFLLLLPILFVNQKYFRVGFKTLFHGSPNMDSLIALGSSAATIYGIVAIFRIGYGLGHGDLALVDHYSMDIYFESAGTILALITLGKYLETKSKGRTSEAITKLMDLAPKTAIVEKADNTGQVTSIEIPVEQLQAGDIVLVKPGSSVPADGIIIEGNSSLDEAAITGESIPVEKKEGDNVIAATINKSGFFKFRVAKAGEDTTLANIIRLVEEASSSKAPIAKLADKIAGIFVPIVIVIAIAAFLIWLLVGATFETALSIGIAVLVISCPCALGLATPVAIMVGTGKGAEHGILIKSGEALETAHNIDTIVLDKTGTITKGKPQVTDIFLVSNSGILEKINLDKTTMTEKELQFLHIAGALEQKSEHPLAEAITEYIVKKGISCEETKEFQALFGKGVMATLKEITYYAGNESLMQEKKIEIGKWKKEIDQLADEGKTPLLFADEHQFLGMIAVADVVKPTSKEAIETLKQMGIHVVMLTGDNERTARAIQRELGIEQVIAQVLPQEKEQKVAAIQKEGHKVAMVGDGINDAPALARADVGIAIGAGTDVAIESADIVLMKSDLLDAVDAIRLSKAVIRNIKQNLFWAFFYNSIGIPLAAGVFYSWLNWRLNPMFGAAAMSLSSVCVVGNALRLKRFH